MNPEPLDAEVLVLGAGPVGLLLALALTELGVRVAIVDRAAETKRDPRAAIVWPRAAEVLRSVGLAARFEAESLRLRHAAFHVDGRYVGTMSLGRLATAHPFPLMIEQHETERLLATRLAERGVRVAWRTEALDLHEGAAGVTVSLRGPEGLLRTASCGWVVGCEGARSLVRARTGIAFEGAPRVGVECLQVNATPQWQHPDDRATGYFFVAPGSTLLACPLPGGGYRLVCFRAVQGPAPQADPSIEEVRAAMATAARTPDLGLAPTSPRWVNRARFQDRVAARLVAGRVALAGDAAHVWTPVGGHGMNTGLRGAQNLAWKLAAVIRGEAPRALLESYDLEQRAAARAVIDGLTRWKTEEPSPAWLVRLLGLALPAALARVDRVPAVEARLTELDAHHRESPLSREISRASVLRAGDRLPDVPLAHEGRAQRSHELLSLHRWTLLATPRGESDAAHLTRLHRLAGRYRAALAVSAVGVEGEAARALEGAGRAVLVRPDGHVAAVARIHDDGPLGEYLDGVLARR